MRVFVAGATGVIGRALVPKLIDAGHEVTGMTRSEARAAVVRATGARAVVADALDAERVRDVVASERAEVVVHQLTALPAAMDFRREGVFDQTNRLRRDGTRILLDAAREAGAHRLVAQSIAFLYAPVGGWVKDEDAAVQADVQGAFGDAVRAVAALENTVTGAEDLQGLVLRYGFFYGPGTSYAPDGHTAREVRRRRFPIVGRGQGTFSFVHVDDAAAATVAAVERGTPGVYNVVDDDPAPMREWLPAYAEALGAGRPLRVPAVLARLAAGREAVALATGMRGASNARAKRELGWRPRYASWRQGFREGLGTPEASANARGAARSG